MLRNGYTWRMKTISQREMRNDSGLVLREVEAGETFTVTRRGAPVAQIVPGEGVVLEGGEQIHAPVVVSNADPQVTLRLLGDAAAPAQALHDPLDMRIFHGPQHHQHGLAHLRSHLASSHRCVFVCSREGAMTSPLRCSAWTGRINPRPCRRRHHPDCG